MPASAPPRVLVIKLGALGDFVLSFAPFAAIRAHHPADRITLLTTAPYADLARQAPWFDQVMVDCRPSWWNVFGLARLARRLRGFDMVYDLQTSARSARYFRLAGRPPWSGIAAGCSLPHRNPCRDSLHTLERQRDQLAAAGLTVFPPPDLAWMTDRMFPSLPDNAALLVPGAASHRPRKRWPVAKFGELAQHLANRRLTPVILGSADDAPLAAAIRAACPSALDLTGQTSIPAIAAIARRARLAVGNDTGPMHLAAAVGCRCVVLFSADSDPALTAPRGPSGSWPILVRENNLANLSVDRVAMAMA